MTHEEMTIAIKDAVKEAFKDAGGPPCCASHCQEQCNITPVEHARDHGQWQAFHQTLIDTGATVRKVATKAAVFGIISLICVGAYYAFRGWKAPI